MTDEKTGKVKKSAEEKAIQEMQDFLQHLGAFVIVNVMLLAINVFSSPGDWWFMWVTFFWGVGLAFHAFDVFVGENKDLARRMAARWARVGDSSPSSTTTPATPAPPVRQAAASSTSSEIAEILREGAALVDRMRADARTIPSSEARREALAVCSTSDQVLSAIEDHPDEIVLARDFLHRFLEPGSKLVRDYARLASRDVPSARRTVAEVEANDLPALTRRANAIYDRMHRGTLIDLEVAREMMALDAPIAPSKATLEPGEPDA